jgi:hypothetical protein
MKGMEGSRLQRRGEEDRAIHLGERNTAVHEKAAGMQTYVDELVTNDNLVTSLIGQGFVEKINDNKGAAELFAKQNDFLIPKPVKELGAEHVIAFVIQLSRELSKPEYNQ